MSIFGNWIVENSFESAEPYPHTVIHNFFTEEAFQSICNEFGNPETDASWIRYWNPIEKKYALNVFATKPFVSYVFQELQCNNFVEKLQQLTNIRNLQNDTYMHGAGLHYHPRGGKLDMHLDYSIHPITKLERKLNLVVYLNNEWKEEWGGTLQLWDKDFTHCVKKVFPYRNTAILFQTSDISYHGIPEPIMCPHTIGRRSLALYYMTHPTEHIQQRLKAEFRPLPNAIVSKETQILYDIRKTRNITDKDLQELNLYEQ